MSEIEQTLEKIRARRAQIERERQALSLEDVELAATERHVLRFAPKRPATVSPELHRHLLAKTPAAAMAESVGVVAARVKEKVAPKKKSRRKPDDVPSIVRMTFDVLRESTAAGKPWLDTNEITAKIKERWWPEVEAAFVQPQLWRAATKRKTLRKDGARYALPKNEKAPIGQTMEASLKHGAEASAQQAASVPAGGVEGIASGSARHQPINIRKEEPAWTSTPPGD